MIQWLFGMTISFLPRSPLHVDVWLIHVLFALGLACV
jgi:hypothetical protein